MDLKRITRFKPSKTLATRIGVSAGIILIGILGMAGLASLKKPPAEVTADEREVRVEVIAAAPEDHQVVISGYGQARALTEVAISPDVSGRVVEIHPNLHAGDIISKGDLLFAIDERNYQSAFDQARASVRQWGSSIERLKKQLAIDTDRLKTIERSRELAQAEFDRTQTLYTQDSVGTRSGVENAERAFNTASDQAALLAQAVALIPIQIREAESNLASARARSALARANLERCRVVAPFDGRVKSVSIEKGQYVGPGQHSLVLVDDSVLEIQVPLDSRDARKWLVFNDSRTGSSTAWFSGLKQIPCTIQWTEDKEGHSWKGNLHRVVRFDQNTRALTVAIRAQGASIEQVTGGELPLVEGMFCEVRIPGKLLSNVFRLPRQAVSFDNSVNIALDNRLKTVPVTVARTEGDFVYVAEGLNPNDLVIITRLVDPLENSLLQITNRDNLS